MKNDLVAQIDAQLAYHEAEAKKLRAARALLAGRNGAPPAAAPRAGGPGKPVKRAPPGHLEDEMEKVIRAKPGQTNQQVRAALAKAAYAYALTPLHVGKRLSAMVDDKRLTVKLDGNLRRYHPAK
jgi:hypothetical protein